MKEKKKNIIVKTLPNGYSLTVEGEDFMYFNEVDLLAGFMAHVGLGETKTMEKGCILSSLFAAMMGDAYNDSVTTLKMRVGLLTSKYTTTIERMDTVIEYVTQAEKTITGLLKRLDDIEAEIKGTEKQYADNKKVVESTAKKLEDIEKKNVEVMNALSNTATILQAMEETKKKKKGGRPSKSEPAASDDSKPKGRGRNGRNKDADAAIVKEIEKKSKKNPNIK